MFIILELDIKAVNQTRTFNDVYGNFKSYLIENVNILWIFQNLSTISNIILYFTI